MDGFGTPRSCPIRVSKSDVSQSATPRASHVALNVIIPMGGLGANEFTEAGYAVPKPMVPIVGRPLLFWLLDNLDLRPGDRVWLGLRRDVEREYGVERAVRLEYAAVWNNPTSMCAYATLSTQALRPCFENSTRAIDPSKNQPNRLRCDRAREFSSLARTTQTSR